MIKASALINLFQRMLDDHWAYELGTAREGCVDCSGAFVWAYKQLGATIEHGSNSIAHLRVGKYVPVSEAKPGYAVFKLREWREDDSGNRWFDQQPGDCYHIGLMGQDGCVLNAQSTKTGFVASPASQNWAFAAPLKAVSYSDDAEGGETMFGNATVKTQKAGSYVNLREGASTRAAVIGKVYDGERVYVLREAGPGWIYGKTQAGAEGYMSADYIVEDAPGADNAEDGGGEETAGTTTLTDGNGAYVTLVGRWKVTND
nr:MAG TPA: SH3 domain protein [Caudoviricetes sp.]